MTSITPVSNSRWNCPECRDELVIREFKSGPREGQQFLACMKCKKGYPLEQVA